MTAHPHTLHRAAIAPALSGARMGGHDLPEPPVYRSHLRPSPDRIIEAHRAPQRSTEARDDTFWAVAGIACLIFLAVAFVVADGIARAFDRPEACRHLSAVECTAKLQEGSAR